MFKLHNTLQHYARGSTHALTDLYGIENPSQQPMAELWMGAHPKSSSTVLIDGQQRSLREVIDADKTACSAQRWRRASANCPFCLRFCAPRSPYLSSSSG